MVLRDLYASGKKKSKASCKHQRCNKDRNRRESKNSDSDHYQKRNKKSSCATSSVSSSSSHRKTSRPVAVNSSRHSKRHAKGKIDEVYEESRDRITAVIPYLDGGDYSEVFYDQKIDSNIRDESVSHRRKGRYRRQTIRLPDEPTRKREVRRRLLTPEPDILERIFLQRQGQDIIEEIIEEPSTPPPRIEERIIYEQSEPPQVTRKVVRVQPSQPVSQHEAVQSTNHQTNQITNTNGASHTTVQGQQTIPQGRMQPASSVAPLPESALNNFRIEIGSTGTTPGAVPISQPPLTNYGVNPQYTDGSGPISAFATSLGYGPSSNAGGIGQTSFGGLPDSISSNGGGALGFSGNFGGGQLSSLANNFAMSCCGGMGGLSMGAGFGAPMGGFGASMGGFGASMGGFGSAGLPFGGMGSASFGSFPGFAGGASFGGGMACPSMPPPMACAPPPQIIQQPVPCPVPVPVPQQVPCPVPVPVPQQIPCPVPVPIREAVPVPQPCPVPVPVPIQNVQIRPIPVPVPQPYPVPCPVPVDRVVCQPVMVPVPQPVPQPCPVPVPQPCPVPVPVPGPVQHVPVPVPQPCPVPVPQPCPVPVSVPSPPQCVPVPVPVPVCAPPPPACPMPNPCASFGGGLASYGAGFGASLPPMMGAGLGSYGAPIGGFGGSLGIGGGLPGMLGGLSGGCGGSLGIGGGLPGMFGGLSGGLPGLGALPPMGGLGGYGGGLGGICGVPIGFGVTTTVGLGNQLPGNMLGGGIPYGAGIPGAFTDFSSGPRSFQNGPHRRF